MPKFSILPKDDVFSVADVDQKFVIAAPPDNMDMGELKRRNDFVIEKTIKEYEAMRAKKASQYDDSYMERSDAVITYLRSLDKGKGSSNIEKYFGKRMLAHLRGEEIKAKLMSGMKVVNKEGQIVSIL